MGFITHPLNRMKFAFTLYLPPSSLTQHYSWLADNPETAPIPDFAFARRFHRNLSVPARIKGKQFTIPEELPYDLIDQ
jgi:hypothetical protein